MKTQNMKREYLGNITQRKKENLNQVIKELKKKVSANMQHTARNSTIFSGRKMLLWKTHHAAENKKGKFRIIRIVLAYMNLNMTTKLPYHPPKSRERGLNKKN